MLFNEEDNLLDSMNFQETLIFNSTLNYYKNNDEALSNFFLIFKKIPIDFPLQNNINLAKNNFKNEKIIINNKNENFNFTNKSIPTPKLNNLLINNTNNNKNSSLKYNQILNIHQQLELLENKIATGLDEKNWHVGQVLNDISESIKPNSKDFEINKIENYSISISNNKIPLFWEHRIWDINENIMTNEETENLKSEITSNILNSECSENWIFIKKNRRRNRINRTEIPDLFKTRPNRNKKAIIQLSSINYKTESDNNITDWSDFEL